MNLSPLPIQKFFDSNGNPLAGGLLFTYTAGTTTKVATAKDQAGTLNTNPIQLDYRGEANVWLDPTLTYKFTLAPAGDTDPPTKPIWTVDNIAAGITYPSLTQQIIGQILYPRNAAEQAAGVTIVQSWYPYGIVDRYKTNTTPGTTDMTSAFTIALSCNSAAIAPNGPYRSLTGPISITGNQSIIGQQGGDLSGQAVTIIHDPASTGPLFQDIGGGFGSSYIGHFEISGGNGTCAVLTSRPQSTFEYLHMEPTGGYNGHGIVTLGGLTLTANPIAGATSATLTDKWTAFTGTFSITFSNGDVRTITLTNGATTMTWSGGLTSGATSNPTFAQGSWDTTLRSIKYVGPNTAGVVAANNYRAFIVNVNGGVFAMEHCSAIFCSVGAEIVQGQNITIYRGDFNRCGPGASDSATDGQTGIRALGLGYKFNLNIIATWIEGSPTSIALAGCNGVSILASFINDLGSTNTPAVTIAADALNVKLDTNFIEVKNTNAAVACVSNAADGTQLINNTWNPSNTGGGALAHGIINTANCLQFGNKFQTTPTTPIVDAGFLLHDIFPVSSSWTGTLTGCTTVPTPTVKYTVVDRQVTLQIPTSTGTSNSVTCTITGLPTALLPKTLQRVLCRIVDNSVTALGLIQIDPAAPGVLTLGVGMLFAAMTNIGNKGTSVTTVTYSLD